MNSSSEENIAPPTPRDVESVLIEPPPVEQRVQRGAVFTPSDERKTRHSLPTELHSGSPVGYRTRLSLTAGEAEAAMPLLSLQRPTAFAPPETVAESEFFEECSLGILSARQSTNYRGQRQTTLGPEHSARTSELLRHLHGLEADVLEDAAYTHFVFCKPYRTPFTMLLTMVGHLPVLSLLTVPARAIRKRLTHTADIPTIEYLTDLHVGILADGMERAAVLASAGKRRAQIHMAPFSGRALRRENRPVIRLLERLAGLGAREKANGWKLAFVVQIGTAISDEIIDIDPKLARKMAANLLAFRTERIQPGVNADSSSPAVYQARQDMDVSEKFTFMAGRATYNAFDHWTGSGREKAKDLLLLDRVDVLTPDGKERLRSLRQGLSDITERLCKELPLWADLPTGRLFSRNTRRGQKAFALAGQRIYIAGLDRHAVEAAGIEWTLALRAVGAAAARSALYVELMGSTEIPSGCDLLAGFCMMAGPVNQNDIGKQFQEYPDLLAASFPNQNPTSLLVWTLKAKTVADPVGNEEQLMSTKRKGALVDLRPGPHEVVHIRQGSRFEPFRQRGGQTSEERAFFDQGNFVTDPEGKEIPGNAGTPWPEEFRSQPMWDVQGNSSG